MTNLDVVMEHLMNTLEKYPEEKDEVYPMLGRIRLYLLFNYPEAKEEYSEEKIMSLYRRLHELVEGNNNVPEFLRGELNEIVSN